MMVVSDVSCVTPSVAQGNLRIAQKYTMNFKSIPETFEHRRKLDQETLDVLKISMLILNKKLQRAARFGPTADQKACYR